MNFTCLSTSIFGRGQLVLLKDAWNIPVMEKVFKERFKGTYPARKTIQTEFAHIGGPDGLHVQIDAIAYKK